MTDRRYPPVGVMLAAAVAAAIVTLYFTGGIAGSNETSAESSIAADGDQALPGRLDGNWERIDLPGVARLNGVWEVGGRLFAAGRLLPEDRAIVWRSDDGRSWLRLEAPDGSFARARVNRVGVFEDQVLAVGSRVITRPEGDATVPAVWGLRPDGTFTGLRDALVDGDDAGGGLSDLTAHDGRLLAIGWFGGALEGSGSAGGAVWSLDADGRFEPVEGLGDLAVTGTTPRRIMVDEGGGLVAIGDANGVPAAWRSTDGAAWVEAGRAEGTETAAQRATVVGTDGPRGVLGVGAVADAEQGLRPLLWNVAGAVWSPPIEGSFDGALPVGADGDAVGYVAVGDVPSGEGTATGGAWVSADGDVWRRVAIDSMPSSVSTVAGVAMFDGGTVIVGSVYDQPAIWFRAAGTVGEEQPVTAAGPLAPPTWSTVFQEQEASDASPASVIATGGRLFGISSERVLWRSDDGVEWTPGSFDEIGLAQADALSTIRSSGDLFVATGQDEGTGMWVSEDGEAWSRPTLAPPCCVVAVAVDGEGLAAFVRSGEEWVIAVSEDGMQWSIDEDAVPLPVEAVWKSASLGRTWLVWGSEQGSEDIRLWSSLSGSNWVETSGPDGAFTNTIWQGVWQFDDRVVVAGQMGDRTVMYETIDGLAWTPLPVLGGGQSPVIRDVAPVGEGLAVMAAVEGRLLGVASVVDGALSGVVEMTPAAGFGGLRAVLVAGDEGLRIVGPDHGRMTVWQWVP